MPKKAEYLDTFEAESNGYWKVWTPELKAEKNKPVILVNKAEEPRSYPLTDDWIQKKIFNQLMHISEQESALKFTEEWGLFLDADSIRLDTLIDSAKSIKWLFDNAQSRNKEVLASRLDWPFVLPKLLIGFDVKNGRIRSTFSTPSELYGANTAQWQKVSSAYHASVERDKSKRDLDLEPVLEILGNAKFQEQPIKLHEIVAVFLNEMLEQVAPVVVSNGNRLTLTNFPTPWSAIVHQLIQAALGLSKPDNKCRKPTCHQPAKKRKGSLYCSDAHRKWCHRHLDGEN